MDGKEELISRRLTVIFTHISNFGMEKVKELIEIEKECNKPLHPQFWSLFLQLLHQIVIEEKQYSTLNFQLPKGFLRKENSLKSMYESSLAELENIGDALNKTVGSFQLWVSTILPELTEFFSSRLKLISFYEELYLVGIGQELPQFLKYSEDIKKVYKDHISKLGNPILAPLKKTLGFECQTLENMMAAMAHINHSDYFQSLMKIDAASSKLKSWFDYYQALKEDKKMSFASTFFLRPQQEPYILQWLSKLKGDILSKFTIYFYNVLVQQANPYDMKTQCAKLSTDYSFKISSFQKKTDAASVCLVFEAAELEGFRGPGYHHPDKALQSLTGLELYPASYSTPGLPPITHWPNVIMILAENESKLSSCDSVVTFYDSRVQSTYFLSKVDERMTLVAIYSTKKSQKDYLITNFLLEVCSQLRCQKIFVALKQGS